MMNCGRMLSEVQIIGNSFLRRGIASRTSKTPNAKRSPFATMVAAIFKNSKRYPTVPMPSIFPVVGSNLHGPCNKKSAKPLEADTTESVKVKRKNPKESKILL